METIGNRLFRLRKELKLSQVDVASKTKQGQTKVSKHEKDQIAPTIEILRAYAALYGNTLDYLIDGKEYEPKPLEKQLGEMYALFINADDFTKGQIMGILMKSQENKKLS